MNLLDQRLFDSYCDPILQRAENFDETYLRNLFDSVNLEKSLHMKLLDALLDLHYQWSLDAFAAGLHLGLSLHPAPRRAVESQTTQDGANQARSAGRKECPCVHAPKHPRR